MERSRTSLRPCADRACLREAARVACRGCDRLLAAVRVGTGASSTGDGTARRAAADRAGALPPPARRVRPLRPAFPRAHVDRRFHQVANHGFDVAAVVADFGVFRGFHFDERAPASHASRRAISVLPTPVGPIIRIFFGTTSSASSGVEFLPPHAIAQRDGHGASWRRPGRRCTCLVPLRFRAESARQTTEASDCGCRWSPGDKSPFFSVHLSLTALRW